MAKQKFVIFKDQIRDFFMKGWDARVIGRKGNIILVEAEVPEENEDISLYQTEERINEPGEC